MTWSSRQIVVGSTTTSTSPRKMASKSRIMSLDSIAAQNTICNKGHVHRPWPTTGVLQIAKCESVCGFCQKETKAAANLRKHVAIHIKNEGLNLSIAEGSSGRGRLEMPSAQLERATSTSSRMSLAKDEDAMETSPHYVGSLSTYKRPSDFSPSAVLMSMASQPSHSRSSYPAYSHPTSYSQPSTLSPAFSPHSHSHARHQSLGLSGFQYPNLPLDPFKALREHNLSTKSAWTAIPASEGFRILDLCKSLSVAQHEGSSSRGQQRVPCYNRETIFDEEWQAHMKNVHGLFLLWPKTWMRRIEVLDLDAFGGDIGACNEVIMDS